MLKIQRMVKRCPPIIIPSRRFLIDFLATEVSSSVLPGAQPSGQLRETAEYINVPPSPAPVNDVYMSVGDGDTLSMGSRVSTLLSPAHASSAGLLEQDAGANAARASATLDGAGALSAAGGDVAIYVFNDIILVASHTVVRGVLNLCVANALCSVL